MRAPASALPLALAICALAACAHPQRPPSSAPHAAPPPTAAAVSAPEPAPPPAPPPFDPLVLLPASADAAISYTGRTLKSTWLWHLVHAAVNDRAPSFERAFSDVCGISPLRAIDQLDVDLSGLGETANPGFVAVFQLLPGLDPRTISVAIELHGGSSTHLEISNGIMTFARSPDHSPVVFAYTDPTRFIAAASPAGSFDAFVDALHRGLPLRGSPALADLIGQVAPQSVAWIAIAGGTKASDAQAALGIRPVSLVASASFAGALTITARLRLDSADAARKVAALIQAQLGKLGGRFDEFEVGAAEADVTLRVVMSQAQAEAFAATLGVHLPSEPR
jgi:hypothetical protein